MARGQPLVVGGILACVLTAGGWYTTTVSSAVPIHFGAGLSLLGVVILLLGVRVQMTAAPEAKIREDEELLVRLHPTQKPALLLLALGIVGLILAMYLLYFTRFPYIYPMIAASVGILLTGIGGSKYYRNTLTTYLVTDQRAIREFRFWGKYTSHAKLVDANGGTRSDRWYERLVGAGSLTVRTPAVNVTFESIPNPDDVAAIINDIVA